MLPWRLSPKHPKPSQTSAAESAKPTPAPDAEAGLRTGSTAEASQAKEAGGGGTWDRSEFSRPPQARADGAGADFPLSGRLGAVPQE